MSRVLVCGVTAGPLLGLSSCAYELSNWGAPSGDTTVTVPDTSEDPGESSTGQASGDGTFSGGDTSPSGPADPCDNDRLDEGETAIDCGGTLCQACGVGLPCKVDTDCRSGVCDGVCLADGCSNGQTDGDETDEDCGGGCAPCPDEAHCATDSDCRSGVCEDETCQAATCEDGVKNGDEADEDCGTEECGLCENGATCARDEQCALGSCKEGICADPQCNDNRKNGDESDVDCGGSCPPCKTDLVCRGPDDCESHVCLMTSSTSGRCADSTCDDGKQNGQESHVDCGGGLCDACADGDPCVVATDCQSSVCDTQSKLCSVPACNDQVRNGNEMGIDCGGGECDGCPEGTPCGSHTDCASNSCNQTCRAPTCADGRTNQSESDVDCGGDCGACSFGRTCNVDADCLSNDCDATCQLGVVGAACASNTDCRSGSCTDSVCEAGYRGAACTTGADCHSGYCRADNTCGSGGKDALCQQGADCASGLCNGVCLASRINVRSDNDNDTSVVKMNMQVQANSSDLSRQWKDIAFLYFFSLVPPEARVNFQARAWNGPNATTKDSRFLALQGDGTDWVMIWRALASNTTTMPSGSSTLIDLHMNNSNWLNFNQQNDYSYRTGGYGTNTKIVVCYRTDGRWAHIQGTPPDSFPDPCSYVVDSCNDTTATCDVLERTD